MLTLGISRDNTIRHLAARKQFQSNRHTGHLTRLSLAE